MKPLLAALVGLSLAACSTAPTPPTASPTSLPEPPRPAPAPVVPSPTPAPAVPAPAPSQPATPPSAAGPALSFAAAGFQVLPDWSAVDHASARKAFRLSCATLLRRDPAQPLSAAATYAGKVADWVESCRLADSRTLGDRAFFETLFQPWAVAADGSATGRLTSYFEPEYDASRARTATYDTPIQGRPADLITVDLASFDPALTGRTIVGRVEGGRLQPYPERAAIGVASAPVLAWANAADVFFLQVQGSGRLKFADGTSLRAAFAAHNGRPFRSPGAELIRRGELTRDNASADAIKAWMQRAGPEAARDLINVNPRTVFFALEPIRDASAGPRGGQGVALTAGASLAVDTTVHPYGVPILIDADAPVLAVSDAQRRVTRLVVSQDTGGAITGPLRGDLFWGTGAAAGLMAGRMNHQARWWALLPRGLNPQTLSSSE